MYGPNDVFPIILQKLRRSLKQRGLAMTMQAARAFAGRRLRQRLLLLRAASVRNDPPRPVSPLTLIVDHDWGGGAFAWRQAHARALVKEGRCVLIWQYLAGVNRHLLEWRTQNSVRLYAGDKLEKVMAFVRKAAPQRIICNELAGWERIEAVLAFLRELRQCKGAWLEVPIHDYFAVCPTIVLLDRKDTYCGVPDAGQCAACLPGHPFKPRGAPDAIAPWRKAWGAFLESADEVWAPDQSAREILGRAYPALHERITVMPHEPLAAWKPLPLPRSSAPPVIGLIGTISQAKGAALVRELARLIQEEMPEAHLVLLGTLEGATPRNLRITGPYRHAHLPDLLQRHGVTVCLVPSICPETFCYVAQEIEQLGLPLVCLDLGAQGRRAKAYAKGTVAKTPDARGCLEALKEVEKRRQANADGRKAPQGRS